MNNSQLDLILQRLKRIEDHLFNQQEQEQQEQQDEQLTITEQEETKGIKYPKIPTNKKHCLKKARLQKICFELYEKIRDQKQPTLMQKERLSSVIDQIKSGIDDQDEDITIDFTPYIKYFQSIYGDDILQKRTNRKNSEDQIYKITYNHERYELQQEQKRREREDKRGTKRDEKASDTE